jgi:hypothetical protein
MTGIGSLMNDWNIQSRAHTCQSCGKAFADQEIFHTLLSDAKKGFLRQDLCRGCWDSQFGAGSGERHGFVSHWQNTYEAAPPPPPDPIQKETAETLLRKLIQENDPAHAPACFILAVMLERKRLLRVKEQVKREGRRYFIYEQPKTGDVFTVVDPDLHLDQLEEVQRDVAQLLGRKQEAPAAGPSGQAVDAAEAAVPVTAERVEEGVGAGAVAP